MIMMAILPSYEKKKYLRNLLLLPKQSRCEISRDQTFMPTLRADVIYTQVKLFRLQGKFYHQRETNLSGIFDSNSSRVTTVIIYKLFISIFGNQKAL